MPREVRLSQRDERVANLLVRAGMKRAVARTLLLLAKVDETTSREIERGTGLRQPEVSIATQELRRRRWVEKRDVRREGKGRPVHAYRLVVPMREIVAHVERRQRRRIAAIEKDLKRLRAAVR